MKARQGTARRYAKALFMITRDAGTGETAARELERFQEVIRQSPELGTVLGRPWVKPAERHAVALAVAERVGCGRTVRDLVALVASRGRMDHLREIVEAYRALVDEAAGRVRAVVRTAVPLIEDERRRLAGRLERALGKQVILEESVDASLLGGFVAQVGSLILDGSLDGQLQRMRERLARG
ncbi:MAG: ATP synthase F1 subunit delta [Candidatus Rokubacteria bacterium]|nr:ATP synthase F1 subunit delta [Candidatus Rokubacteria bacterium]